MQQPLKVAVIGCGGIVRSTYMPAFQDLSETLQIAAVCDLKQANAEWAAQTLGGTVSVWTDAAAMLKAESVEAVLVLTTEKASAPTAQRMLEFNLPIYLEKPPALNVAELDGLIAAEAESRTFIYTAFNRRHTPLFAGRHFSASPVRRVTGVLSRTDRIAKTFPYTAVHVIDSAQYFAAGVFESWNIRYDTEPNPRWTVEGRLENGATASLQFIPSGSEFLEYLTIETDECEWTLRFPNIPVTPPEGELVQSRAAQTPLVTRGQISEFHAAAGFNACLRDFVAQVRTPDRPTPHRLPRARATVGIMDEMCSLAG